MNVMIRINVISHIYIYTHPSYSIIIHKLYPCISPVLELFGFKKGFFSLPESHRPGGRTTRGAPEWIGLSEDLHGKVAGFFHEDNGAFQHVSMKHESINI